MCLSVDHPHSPFLSLSLSLLPESFFAIDAPRSFQKKPTCIKSWTCKRFFESVFSSRHAGINCSVQLSWFFTISRAPGHADASAASTKGTLAPFFSLASPRSPSARVFDRWRISLLRALRRLEHENLGVSAIRTAYNRTYVRTCVLLCHFLFLFWTKAEMMLLTRQGFRIAWKLGATRSVGCYKRL